VSFLALGEIIFEFLPKLPKTGIKARAITVVSGILLAGLFYLYDPVRDSLEVLTVSFLVTTALYDFLWKYVKRYIREKVKGDSKPIDDKIDINR
jgi:LPXTG-motif cell wall-anchored protein